MILSGLPWQLWFLQHRESLQRLEIYLVLGGVNSLTNLKNALSHLKKLKYLNFHLKECYPPLCLSREALKHDKNFSKTVALAKDLVEAQPRLQFIEANHFLY